MIERIVSYILLPHVRLNILLAVLKLFIFRRKKQHIVDLARQTSQVTCRIDSTELSVMEGISNMVKMFIKSDALNMIHLLTELFL